MTTLVQRGLVMALLREAMVMGARQDRACAAVCLNERTLQRWQREAGRGDQRPQRLQLPKNKLSTPEREHLVAVANSAEFGHLPPGQIVPRLADRGLYLASESTFHRVLKAQHQLRHRGAQRPAHQRSKPRALCAVAPGELFSWDINHEHRHSAIRFVTPSERHAGLDAALLSRRAEVYKAAKWSHPERWRGATPNSYPIRIVYLNPDQHGSTNRSRKKQPIELKKIA